MGTSIKDIYEKIGFLIEKRTLLILFIAIILVIGSFNGAKLIKNESGIDTVVDRSSLLYQNFEHLYNENFGTEAIVVIVESEDITSPEVLKAMDRFVGLLESKDNVDEITSISSIIKNVAQTQSGHSTIPENKNTIKQIISTIPQEYIDKLLPDQQDSLIFVEMPGDVTEEEKIRVLTEAKTAIEWADFPAGTYTTVTGDPAFRIAMSEEMTASLSSMLIISFILMIVALIVVFNHVRWCLLPLPAVLVGLIWTFGAMGYMNVPMTMASMAVFPILIGLGVDYAIQFHSRAEEELAKGESASEAIIETVKHMGPAVGTAMIATCLGFVALFISPVPMIRDFGKMSLIGVILCYLSSIFVLVPMLYILDRRSEKNVSKGKNVIVQLNRKKTTNKDGTNIGRTLSKISVNTAKNPLIIIVLATILTVVGLYADEKVGVQTDTEKFVPQDMEALSDLNKLSNIMGGTGQINIIVKAEDITDPEVLQWMDDFGEYEVESQSNIYSYESLATPIKIEYGLIPSDADIIDTIVSEMSTSVKERYVEGGDMGILNLNINGDLGTEEVAALIDGVERDLEWYPPKTGVDVTVTGNQVAETSVLDALTSGRSEMTYLGLIVIFSGLLIVYRDWLKAFVPIIPILMVTGWTGGVMYLLDLKYNPLTATLGALVIGIGAEFTILMMERYFEERDEGHDPFHSMDLAASNIGQAIMASGSTVLFGFSALIAAPFAIINEFGLVTVIAVAFSLFSTLVVLPPIMVNLDIWRTNRKEKRILRD